MKKLSKKEVLKRQIITDKTGLLKMLSQGLVEPDSKYFNEVIQLESRYNTIVGDRRKGTVSTEEIDLRMAKFDEALISMIDKWHDENLIESIVPKNNIKLKDNSQEVNKKFELELKHHGLTRKLRSKEGFLIYKNERVNLLQIFEGKAENYCKLGYYQLRKKSEEDKFDLYDIGGLKVKLLPCTENYKRYIWIGIEYPNVKVQPDLKKALDIFTLEYDDELKLIWSNNNNPELQFTSEELAEMILVEVFEYLMKKK